MKQNKILEKTKQEQTEQLQEIPQELSLSDGQTEDLPEFNQEPEQNSQSQEEFSQVSLMMTTNDDRYYSQSEFEKVFSDFLEFLKNPATAADTFETVRAQGQSLAASKVFEMAKKYNWLNWIIDKKTQIFHDSLLIAIFAITESNAVIMNWTGVSVIEKGKIWLKSKIKQHAQAAQSGKRSVLGFLGLRGAEKQQKQEN